MNIRRMLLAIAVVLVVGAGAAYFVQADRQSRARAAAVDEAELALTSERDPAKALRVVAEALLAEPGDFELLVLRGRAYDVRGRYSDALDAFESAALSEDPERHDELVFLTARARTMRYLDTGDRGDFNLVESDLERLTADPTYGGGAKVLLGLGLVRQGLARERDRARKLLQDGLATAGVGDHVNEEKARDWLARMD